MSLILDALRKSDRERRLGEVPTLGAPVALPQPQSRNHRLHWLIAALVLVNVAVVAWLLLREDGSTPGASAPRLAAAPPVQQPPTETRATAQALPFPEKSASPAPPLPDRSAAETANARRPAPTPARTAARRTEPQAEPSAAKPKPEAVAAAKPQRPPRERPARPAPPPVEATQTTADHIPYIQELPADFRRNLPTMAINVYVHSEDPNERFVIINMNKYRSGQRIKEGPLIESIDPDSLVLDHAGRRFRLPRP